MIFAIIYGIAIQKLNSKQTFLTVLEVIRTASVTIWGWVVMLAPLGVCALFATTAGSLEPEALADLSLYLISFVFGTLILALWILPSIMTALCPLTNRGVLRDLQSGLVIAVVTSLSVAALPYIQQATEKLAARMEIDVTAGVSATVEDPDETSDGGANPDNGPSPQGSILDNIQKAVEIRVGYNPDIVPFSYRNNDGDLVGYDIANVYQLAQDLQDLNVRLRLIPFTWQKLDEDLSSRRFDMAVAGIYVTEDRLRRFVVSEPYYGSPVAPIVRTNVVERFLSRESIMAQTDLTVAVFDDPIMINLADRILPGVKVVVLPSYSVLEDHPEVDAAIWTLEQAKAWAAPRANYTAVVPRNLGGQFLIGYLMPEGAEQPKEFLHYWLRLQRVNGFRDRLVSKWIDGKPVAKQQPRVGLPGRGRVS